MIGSAPLRAESPAADETAEPNILFDSPADLSTPLPNASRSKVDSSKFTAGLPTTPWNAKVGIDNRTGTPNSALRPERWPPGAALDQPVGVGWANITAPGLMTWDKTSIESRIDPSQQGRLGVTLSRSIPVGGAVADTAERLFADPAAAPGLYSRHRRSIGLVSAYDGKQPCRSIDDPAGRYDALVWCDGFER